MPNLIKPKFLRALIEKSFAIMELKIKYKQRNIISFTVLLDKNLKSFLYKIKKINEKSINRILNKEIAGPIIIDAGIKENKKRK